jgi:hypothetical protein
VRLAARSQAVASSEGGVSQGIRSGVRRAGRAPGCHSTRGAWRHRRALGRAIPRSGCAPAEPASVSPGAGRGASGRAGCKAKERRVGCPAAWRRQ